MTTKTRADLFGDPDRSRVSYERRGPVAVLTLKDVNFNGYTYNV